MHICNYDIWFIARLFLGGIAMRFVLKVVSDNGHENYHLFVQKKTPIISELLKFMLSLFSET